MKDSTVRIDSVLTFIQNYNVLGPNVRMRAWECARNFILNRYPPGNAGQVAYENFSSAMSLGFHMRSDPNDIRQMKRAAYLLTKAIKATPGAFIPDIDPRQLPDGLARAKFEDVMRKAACVRDAGLGSPQSAQDVMAAMDNHPLAFLSTNKLVIYGSLSAGNGPGNQNVLPFKFHYEITSDRYKIEPAHPPAPGAHQFNADSIVAQFWTTACDWAGHPPAGDFRQIQAIECGSPFMVTTQFTGCSFCMKRHLGHVYCAHVAPTRAPTDGAAPILTGTQVGQRIDDNAGVHGDFANAPGGVRPSIYAPAFSARLAHPGYPNGLGGGRYMTIIGFQRGPDYEIYSQITENDAITSAQRIF